MPMERNGLGEAELLSQHHRKIVRNDGIGRVDLERPRKMPERLRQTAGVSQDVAEIVVGRIMLRIERNGFAVLHLGQVQTAVPHMTFSDLREALRIIPVCPGVSTLLVHAFAPEKRGIHTAMWLTSP